jgi:hypothetical protein
VQDRSQELTETGAQRIQGFLNEELAGEAFFTEIYRLEVDALTRRKLAHLVQIEHENADLFRATLLSHGRVVTAAAAALDEGRAMAQALYHGSWRTFLEGMRDRLRQIHLPRFRAQLEDAEQQGCAIEIEACRLMVDHDVALFEFAERDLEGRSIEYVLQPLQAALRSQGSDFVLAH